MQRNGESSTCTEKLILSQLIWNQNRKFISKKTSNRNLLSIRNLGKAEVLFWEMCDLGETQRGVQCSGYVGW